MAQSPLPNYIWNPRLGSTGRFVQITPHRIVSRERVMQLLNSQVQRREQRLLSLTRSLLDGNISQSVWVNAMKNELRQMHLQLASLGAGGWQQLGPVQTGRIGGLLNADYRRLVGFANDIASGKYVRKDGTLSEAAIFARVEMYAGNARIEYWANQKCTPPDDKHMVIERRQLGIAEHCEDCVAWADVGWQLPEVLPIPGRDSKCLTACKCTLERVVIPVAEAERWLGFKVKQEETAFAEFGGPGSGNWGHAGRPGKIGGSAPRAGGGGGTQHGTAQAGGQPAIAPVPGASAVKVAPAGKPLFGGEKGKELIVMPAKVGAAEYEAMTAIMAVHGDGGMRRIPVRYVKEIIDGGDVMSACFVHETPTGPAHIEIVPGHSNSSALDLAHEIGHQIDREHLGNPDPRFDSERHGGAYNSDLPRQGRMGELFDTIAQSQAIRNLYARAQNPQDYVVTERYKGQMVMMAPSQRAIREYYLEPTEVFARAYAQYIATRSGNKVLQTAVQTKRQNPLYPDAQWDDNDFAPIAKQFDKLFQSIGWQAPVASLQELLDQVASLGGPGSGNWGHAGRPGKIGGSAPRTGGGGGEKVVHGSRASRPAFGDGQQTKAEQQAEDVILRPEEKESLSFYGRMGYRVINPVLRGQPIPLGWPTMTMEELNRHIADIQSACDQLPAWEGTVYRGLHFRNRDEWEERVGELMSAMINNTPILSPAFTSSSLEREMAVDFAKMGKLGLLLNIKSKTGAVIDGQQEQPAEHEVLFKPGARFRVVDQQNPKEGVQPILIFFLEEIAPTAELAEAVTW